MPSPLIDPTLGLILMLNNYLHDVATALLAASAFTLWILARTLGRSPSEETIAFFLAVYEEIRLLAIVAFAWIILGGIPRAIFYRSFEYAEAVGHRQVPALILKHILMGGVVLWGLYAWFRLRRRIAALKRGSSAC